ncbi:hypothetical protein H2O64_21995 [Kordia sp. YSTF-M3]|uniref:Phage portal protein n=1 Tax=Kordia aestuariivivens TaxID=2759037 RepID=A0ABR7QFM3_9FLAO|nr:hypothetical protein [Kordia aestuariivivens]MBC8757357.1 hypothetical protein [Kordia aestuariivivens]
MNKKVWHSEKTMMYFINTTASKILSLADGKKLFSNLVAEAFAGSKIESINDETLESFQLETELNDRFFQSTAFCISMWERQLLNFKISNTENVTIPPLAKEAIDSNGNLTVEKAYSIIAKEDKATEYKMYNQLKANLAMLFAYDMVFIKFTGSMEDSNENVVTDSDLPRYKIGYLQPNLLKNMYNLGDNNVIRMHPILAATAGSFAADAVKVAAEEAGTTAGDIVGRMESR